jgi:hypothetical protein
LIDEGNGGRNRADLQSGDQVERNTTRDPSTLESLLREWVLIHFQISMRGYGNWKSVHHLEGSIRRLTHVVRRVSLVECRS